MRVGNRRSLLAKFLHRRDGSAICAAPTQNEQFTLWITIHLLLGDVVHNTSNLLIAQHRHLVVIKRIIADIPSNIRFFYTTNAVL